MNETPQFLPPRGPQDIFPGDPCEAFPYLNSIKETGFILETGPPWPLPSWPLSLRAGEFAVTCVLRFDRGWECRDIPLSCLRVPSWRVVPAVDHGSRWPQDLLPTELEALRTIATGASPEAEACLGIIKRLTGVEIRPRDQKEETDPR